MVLMITEPDIKLPADVTTSPCFCCVGCIAGIVGSVCITIFGTGIMVVVVVLLTYRQYIIRKNSVQRSVEPEPLVSENVAYVQSARVSSMLPAVVVTSSVDDPVYEEPSY